MRLTPPLALLLLSTTAAAAMKEPTVAPKDDAHMQTVAYAAGEVTELHLMVGRTVAIMLPPAETNNQSFGSDTAHLKAAVPAGTNLIFLKPVAAMAPKPFFIQATMPDGGNKLYTLQVDVTAAAGDATLPYTLRFVDPNADAAARAAAWRGQQRARADQAAHAALADAQAHPVDTNAKYVLQGETAADWNLLPTREVGDDGANTHFHLPGARSPVILTVTPDGREAVPDCSPDSSTHVTTCHQLAARWRLRDGDAELCIFNHAFDPVGAQAPSSTSSPRYQRTLRAAQ